MRPIPAQRIGHTHGLLKALEQRGKLRLEEFVTEFSEAELFPPGLEKDTGRTRQFVSYARAAGLVKEDRGTVELTDLGKRYIKSADRRDVFMVSFGQQEWLRRQLREKHLTESIWNGAGIALSLYNTLPEGDWVALIDVGRAAAHLGRVGWDNDATFQTQGERLTWLLQDMGLIDESRALTDAGRETIAELRLPLHAGLQELAGELNPGGPEGAAAAAAAERDQLGLGSAPAAESALAAADPQPDASIEAPQEPEEDLTGTGEWVDVATAAAGASAAAEQPTPPPPAAAPEPPAPEPTAPEPTAPAPALGPIEAAAMAAAGGDELIAGPDEPTRSYPVPTSASAPGGGAAGSSVAEDAAPAITAPPQPAAPPTSAPGGSAPPPGVSQPPPAQEPPAPAPPPPAPPPSAAAAPPPAPPPPPPAAPAPPPPAPAPPPPAPAPPPPAPAGGVAAAAAAAAAHEAAPESMLPGAAGQATTEEQAMSIPAGGPPDQPPAAPPASSVTSDSKTFQSGIRPTTAITAIRPEDLANWKATHEAAAAAQSQPGATAVPDGGPFLDPAEVRGAAERRGLVIDPGVYAAAIAALASGRHLVLTGGAGSGKTALALAIAEAAVRQGRCKSILFTSAGSGLGSRETLGRRNRDSGQFEPGLVPNAIESDQWLVIDELDRVSIDRALGRLSTVLGGQPVDLPGGGELKPPPDWRLIATMADIEQVGQTTPALRRRFVFVEVPALERADLEKLVDAWAGDDTVAAAVGRRLVAINDVIPLGPGLYRDAVAYVKARRKLADAEETDLTLEALAGFVLPQLEGAGDDVAARAVGAVGLAG